MEASLRPDGVVSFTGSCGPCGGKFGSVLRSDPTGTYVNKPAASPAKSLGEKCELFRRTDPEALQFFIMIMFCLISSFVFTVNCILTQCLAA